jgi:sugar phosphate isomerase/epimerase
LITRKGNRLMSIPTHRFGCATGVFGGPLPGKLQAMQKAGFAATELLSGDLFESMRGPDWTVERLRESGLAISIFQLLRDFEGSHPDLLDHKLEVSRQIFGHARLVGSDTVVLGCNTDPAAGGDRKRIVSDLARLAEVAAEEGIRIAYESLSWGTWASDYRVGWSIVQEVNAHNLGVMLDSSHIGALDLPFDAIADIDPDKIYLAEIADLPRMRMDIAEMSRYYRLFPGEGLLDLEAYIRRLEEIGYAGYYSLEVFNAHNRQLPPAEVAEKGFDALCRLWERAVG